MGLPLGDIAAGYHISAYNYYVDNNLLCVGYSFLKSSVWKARAVGIDMKNVWIGKV